MQAVIKFKCNNLKLPIHYNHIIQGFIYNNIKNRDFREFLHEEGFKKGKRSFKLFTFSRLYGKYKIDSNNKTITFKYNFSLTVSSLVDDFINDFLQTCLLSNELQIDYQPVKVIGVEIEERKGIKDKILIKTLSPIVTYSTVTIEGRKKTIYHSPYDNIFEKHIRENLLKKSEVIGEKIEDDTLTIKPAENSRLKENITYFKKIIVKGWSGVFELQGNPRLLEIALGCGLGAKNSQGYGCIKMIRAL